MAHDPNPANIDPKLQRKLAILTVRDEAAFLPEWLAHHRAVGFTDFLIASNDCSDGTDALLDLLAARGEVTHLRNDGPHRKGVQWSALKLAFAHPVCRAADWIAVLDIDEFVNIHVGAHHLDDLIAALPDATEIALVWRLFGNAGLARYVPGCVTDQFTKAAPEVMFWPWRAFQFKTLFRNNGRHQRLGVHRPQFKPGAPRAWFDSAGRPFPPDFVKGKQSFVPFGRNQYALAQLNHYALQSAESFVLKSARGRANHDQQTIGADYWIDRNFNQVEDRSIARYQVARDAALATILGDPAIRQVWRDACQWRTQTFTRLMGDESMAALFARVQIAGPSRLVSAEEAKIFITARNERQQSA